MICEEDAQLFEAAKKAQVNRNTAINIIENSNASVIIAGAFVRVLLEMPNRHEGYMVARVQGTSTGEPYSGFSTNVNQTTSVYLMLELPPQLAAINGVQYQMNSVSNTLMAEGEFRAWLEMLRVEPTLREPSVADLEDVGMRLQPFTISRHRSGTRGNGACRPPNESTPQLASPPALPQHLPQQQPQVAQPQQRALSARAAGYQNRKAIVANSSAGFGAALQAIDGRSPVTRSAEGPLPRNPAPTGGGTAVTTATSSEGRATPRASVDGSLGANRLVRQGTVMTRDYNRNPRVDGQASNEVADADRGYSNGRSTSPRAPSAAPASAAAIPFLNRGAVARKVESEDEELERRMRQDILNHLAQECVLFPKDATGYKLSRLRLLERDMVEYLQHVREEIQGKQENCVVCFDHVPTVILLPCKHKMMCRLCAPSVSQCPVCRSQIEEMFEPEEI